MAEIKGILLNAWMTFLNNRYGAQTIAQELNQLNEEDRLLLSSPFLASSWYPYSTLHSFRQLTQPLTTPADQNLSFEIGSYLAEYVFTGVYKSLLDKEPLKQLEKFSWIRNFFFQETRILETEIINDCSCLVRYRYDKGATPTRAICESLSGFWSKTLELSGAAKVRSTHPKCVVKGATCCEFIFEWEARASAQS